MRLSRRNEIAEMGRSVLRPYTFLACLFPISIQVVVIVVVADLDWHVEEVGEVGGG